MNRIKIETITDIVLSECTIYTEDDINTVINNVKTKGISHYEVDDYTSLDNFEIGIDGISNDKMIEFVKPVSEVKGISNEEADIIIKNIKNNKIFNVTDDIKIAYIGSEFYRYITGNYIRISDIKEYLKASIPYEQ